MQLTGRWPLLLDLAAHSIERRVAMGHSTPEAVDAVVQRLRSAGPAGLDPLDREARRVSASVAASVDTLPTEAQPRFAELAIFPEDIDIPLTAISALWRSTARLDAFESEQVCGALLDASLVRPARGSIPAIRLHDVLRTHLRNTASEAQLIAWNTALLDAAQHNLTSEWWALPREATYLRDHLIAHLAGAHRRIELDRIVTDLRWVAARIHLSGLARLDSDLAHSAHPGANSLQKILRQSAHLFSSCNTLAEIDDILICRVDSLSSLSDSTTAFQGAGRQRIRNRWPRPDAPHPDLTRAIDTGHEFGIAHVSGTDHNDWIATVGRSRRKRRDPTLRIWNPRSGGLIRVIETPHVNGIGVTAAIPNTPRRHIRWAAR